MTSLEYQLYTQSDEWNARRQDKFEEVGYRCEHRTLLFWRCKCHSDLAVHHRHYKTFKHERRQDLQVLCMRHHKQADAWRKFKNRILAKVRG